MAFKSEFVLLMDKYKFSISAISFPQPHKKETDYVVDSGFFLKKLPLTPCVCFSQASSMIWDKTSPSKILSIYF